MKPHELLIQLDLLFGLYLYNIYIDEFSELSGSESYDFLDNCKLIHYKELLKNYIFNNSYF